MDNQSKIILIAGPTASGKSDFALKIAKKVDGEIINADSMQVYKQLKILTARPSKNTQKKVKHHLYGIVNINRNFSTGAWLKLAVRKIKEVKRRNKIPIIVGGTGLYFQSLINGLVKIPTIPIKLRNKIRSMQKRYGQKKFYKKLIKLDPKVKNKFDPNDAQRTIRAFEIKTHTKVSMHDWFNKTKPIFNESMFLKFYINFERSKLTKRIEKRTMNMIKMGAVQEVVKFNKLRIKKDKSINKIIGIDELTKYLKGEIKLKQAKELITIKTRQYAKRQATWARSRMIMWTKIEPHQLSSAIKKITKSSLKLDQLI